MKQFPDLNLAYDFERGSRTDTAAMQALVDARQGLMKEIIESFGEVDMGEVENKLRYSTSYDVDDGSKTTTERNSDDIITGLLRFANAVGLDNFGGDGKWAKAVETMAAWYVANVHQYSQATLTFCPLVSRAVRWDCSGFTTACLWLYGALQGIAWPPTSALYTSDNSVGAKLSEAGFVKMTFSWDTVQPYDIITYPGHVEIYNGLVNGKHTSWAWGACHDTAHGGLPCGTAHQKQGYDVIWRNKYNGTGDIAMEMISNGDTVTYNGVTMSKAYLDMVHRQESGKPFGQLPPELIRGKDIKDARGAKTYGAGLLYDPMTGQLMDNTRAKLGRDFTLKELEDRFLLLYTNHIKKAASKLPGVKLTTNQSEALASTIGLFGHIPAGIANAIRSGNFGKPLLDAWMHAHDGDSKYPRFKGGWDARSMWEYLWFIGKYTPGFDSCRGKVKQYFSTGNIT